MLLSRTILLGAFPIAALVCGSALCEEPPAKLPLPSDAAQAESLQVAKEVYGKEFARAKTKPEKQALAQKLLAKAGETENGSANHYVLLRLARDIATQAVDGQTAFQAIDAMAATFQADDLPMKSAVLATLASVATFPSQHKTVAEEALKLTRQAIGRDRFEMAGELSKLALAEARKANDKDDLAEARDQIAEEAESAKAYEDTQKATVQLEKEPTDPAANLLVGKYKCFAKGDWDGGLVMLALGSDEALKARATQDILGAETPGEQAALGDGWWEYAEKQQGMAKKQIQRRAVFWYSRALPGLSGLVKDKTEKRMKATPQDRMPRAEAGIFGGVEGTWIIRYGIGLGRRYIIDRAGNVTYGDRQARLKVQNGEILLDFQDGKLERLALRDDVLHVDHFNPASRFPHSPTTTAEGKRLTKTSKEDYRRYEGVWEIKYGNGVTRVYSITPKGVVSFMAERQQGRLELKDGEVLLAFENGQLERLELRGSQMWIDHYHRATSYPFDIDCFGLGVKRQ
jgi:hypothetical protein